VALAIHFILFQGSLALTTVASAVTLVTMSPSSWRSVAGGSWTSARLIDEVVIAPVEPPGRRLGDHLGLWLMSTDPAARTVTFEAVE
jgi:hypothetical protein